MKMFKFKVNLTKNDKVNGILCFSFLLILLVRECKADQKYLRFMPNVTKELEPFAVPTLIKANLTSFSGFLNGTNAAKIYFWYFPAETNALETTIVWIEGVLGTSSVRGLFENNGPFYVKTKGLHNRKYHWSTNYNVLYMDTSTGAGYSHANSAKSYPDNMNELVYNLFVSLKSFFNKFDHLRRNNVYLAGDGFACRTITRLASVIDENNSKIARQNLDYPIKLNGLILENGFCDPINTIELAANFLHLRMIDKSIYDRMMVAERDIQNLLRANRYDDAFNSYDRYIKGVRTPYKTLFNNLTHYALNRNLIHDKEYKTSNNYNAYMEKEMIKIYLNIPKELAFDDGKQVLDRLKGELVKSSMADLGQLLRKYDVLMYYGQMNPEISPKLAYQTALSLKWCGGEFFRDVNYSPWYVEKNLAGYKVSVETGECDASLTWAIVRNAGKDIAGEKPQEVFELITKFISNNTPR